MTRLTVTIRNQGDRDRASDLVRTAAVGMRVEIKEEKRSEAQNNLMWDWLGDIAEQVCWPPGTNKRRTDRDWKDMFTAALRKAEVVPNLDGDGFVMLGLHTSDLSKEEFSNLMALMDAFAAERGVTFKKYPDSDSSDGSQAADRTDAPAANAPAAAGATNSEQWRDIAIEMLAGHRERPASLKHRLADLAQENGPFDELQTKWIETLFRLVMKKNKGEIHPVKYDAEINWLRTVPLSALRETA
jgi:hypothetical protein